MQRKIDGRAPFNYASGGLRSAVQKLANKGGGYLPPERELCKLIGVSRGTLKTVLAALASEGLVEIHPRSGNYVKGALPLNFRVGLFLRAGEAPFFSGNDMMMYAGALKEFARHELCGAHQLFLRNPEEILESIEQYSLDGVLWFNPHRDCADAFEKLLASGLPTIAATGFEQDLLQPAENCVAIDPERNIAQQLDHLAGLGCKTIAFLLEGVNRVPLCRKLLKRRGLACGPELFLDGIASLETRLDGLLRDRRIDGIISNGGEERLSRLFTILDAHPEAGVKTIVDCVLGCRTIDPARRTENLLFNVLPSTELGETAASLLLAAKGVRNWRMKPTLVAPEIESSLNWSLKRRLA